MQESRRIDLNIPLDFPSARVRSLVWRADDLFDAIGGERLVRLEGEQPKPPFAPYAYSFDRSISCPGQCHVAIYTARETKGLILGPRRSQRQVNRDYYHAQVYEYPIALGRLRDGREVIAHCPDRYTYLEIEALDSGEGLTKRRRSEFDFFHSRLEFSPNGRFLLSAGWFWHPWDALLVYDVDAALSDPHTLDTSGVLPRDAVAAEVASATFRDDDTVIICTVADKERLDDPENNPDALGALEIASWSMSGSQWKTRAPLEMPAGGLMAAGRDHVVSFHEHPRLIQLSTGRVEHEWSDLPTGSQVGSYVSKMSDVPPIAKDPVNLRFAVASPTHRVTVIMLAE